MHILIASSTYKPAMNGQAVFTTNLAEGLAKRGHQVLVVLDSHELRPTKKLINGVQVEEIQSVSMDFLHAGVYFSPFPGKAVRAIFDSFQPDIVHIQDHYPTCWAVTQTARKRGIKVIGSNHFIPENLAPYVPFLPKVKPFFNGVLWMWMKQVYKHADVISAQSEAAADMIRAQGLHIPVLPVSCGIDLQRFAPDPNVDRQATCQRFGLDPNKKIFLFLGRIDGEKHVDLLLRAMKYVTGDGIQLAIAGHGKEEGPLTQLSSDLNLNRQVHFTGFIPEKDVPSLMNSVDVFVMPSEAELLSISTLEAMACGRPVILANALALPELVRDGANGYLTKPGDVQDFANHIQQMADHPERWKAMGEVSRELALPHSLDRVIQRFDELYSHLVLEQAETEFEKSVRITV
jgi:1,2-diacylglycerol 3-alpha-glucosyltransferase